jgi:hypothetical protein
VSPARRAVKFHVSKSVKDPVLSRHTNVAIDNDDDDDDDNQSQSLDSLEEVEVPPDTFDKLLQSYESLSVVGALLAGFALSLLPSVVEPVNPPNVALSAARLLLALTIGLNFFGICALSLANFYMAQLWEKQRSTVTRFRVSTQRQRQFAHQAIVISVPMFAAAVACFYVSRVTLSVAEPLELIAVAALLLTVVAVLFTIRTHQRAFVASLLHQQRASRTVKVMTAPAVPPPPSPTLGVVAGAKLTAAAGAGIKRFHTKYF